MTTPPPPYGSPYTNNDPFAPNPYGKSRGLAALFAIFLGGLGIQYFYLGKTTAGLITILLSLVTCGGWSLVMLIQGIYMLCINNEQFDRIYIQSTSTLPLF